MVLPVRVARRDPSGRGQLHRAGQTAEGGIPQRDRAVARTKGDESCMLVLGRRSGKLVMIHNRKGKCFNIDMQCCGCRPADKTITKLVDTQYLSIPTDQTHLLSAAELFELHQARVSAS